MGFSKIFDTPSPSPAPATATVSSAPPTVTETLSNDTKADYAQRASRRRGLLSTILSKRNWAATNQSNTGGNTTLG